MNIEKIKIKPQWSQSKDEIWNELFDHLEDTPSTKVVPFYKSKLWTYGIAAAIAVLLLIPSVAYFYTTEVTVGKGELLTYQLPDGSTTQINADSKLSFKPLWWNISREINLDGEAYFEVKKGKQFSVVSTHGRVSVLGTSFNVKARATDYEVACLEGKVKVNSKENEVILTQGMQTEYTNGVLSAITTDGVDKAIGWTKNMFHFNSIPLSEVLNEVERQYNITIDRTGLADFSYSGSFPKLENPQEVLRIIEKPFNLNLKIIN